jgi:hypothetical protein
MLCRKLNYSDNISSSPENKRRGFSLILTKSNIDHLHEEAVHRIGEDMGVNYASNPSTNKQQLIIIEKVSSKELRIKSMNTLNFPEGFFISKEEAPTNKKKTRTTSFRLKRKRRGKKVKMNKNNQFSHQGIFQMNEILNRYDSLSKYLLIF